MRDQGIDDEGMIVSYLCVSAFAVGVIAEGNNWDTSFPGEGNE